MLAGAKCRTNVVCTAAVKNKPKGYRFPSNIDVKKKKRWIIAVRRDQIEWSPSSNSVVCEDHFLPTDFLDGPTAAGKNIYISHSQLSDFFNFFLPYFNFGSTVLNLVIFCASFMYCPVQSERRPIQAIGRVWV